MGPVVGFFFFEFLLGLLIIFMLVLKNNDAADFYFGKSIGFGAVGTHNTDYILWKIKLDEKLKGLENSAWYLEV